MNRMLCALLSASLFAGLAVAQDPEPLRIPEFPPGKRTSPLIGITPNVTEGGGVQQLLDTFLELRQMGANVMMHSGKWSDLEPQPSKPEVGKKRDDLNFAAYMGFYPVLTIQTIDTNNRTLPSDLMDAEWDEAAMLARWEQFLVAYEKAMPPDVEAVSLGNEVDIYLREHPDETDAYLRFLAKGREVLRQLRPNLAVGVTTTYEGLVQDPDLIAKLLDSMDCVVFTYYFSPSFGASPADQVPKAFREMTRLARGRPLVIQEIGCAASPLVGGSEAIQAEFMREVFRAIRRHEKQLHSVSLFLLVDFGREMLDELTRYYGVEGAAFRDFLGTLGLKKADGTPRPAWDVVVREMAVRQEAATR